MAGKAGLKGWFSTRGRAGDRTLDQQLAGLDDLFERVPNKTVLDVGCAEGLIAIELARRGARAVHGIEIVRDHVVVANDLRDHLPVTFEVADANTYAPRRVYDIVIMLALLQKLKDPSAACKRFAKAARELVVLRLPPLHAPTIIDARSGNKPHDMQAMLESCGFARVKTVHGTFNEWIGYYERRSWDPL